MWLEGDYVPLWGATDADRRHLVAFARRLGRETMITVAPRLVDGLLPAHSGLPLAAELWQDAAIELPPELPAAFTNVITGERVEAVADGERRLLRAADMLGACPVAVLQHTQS